MEELPPLRVRDLFLSTGGRHEMVRQLVARVAETVRNSHGLVINTFEALETAELDMIRGELHVAFVLAAGPLHKLSTRSTGSSLLQQERTCIEWLDTHVAGSVLYVSFGSLVSMDCGELSEVAWGLANSGQPCLWVIRPDLMRGSDGPGLPEGFDRVVERRGKVISWAPQQEVLAHSAVGGFWTHNGWNSTLESISEGIPMICMPQFADQMMNTRYVEAAWSVGFELEGDLERNKIEEAIRILMQGSRGEEMRERARELKKKVASCLESGGSSVLAIDKLIEHISSL